MNNLNVYKKIKNDSSRTFFINNQNSEVDYTNGTITYKLKQPMEFNNEDIGIKKITMYYSFNTFATKYNNLSFSIIHNSEEHVINIEPGMYTLDDLDAYLKFKMDELGLYIENNETEKRTYFLSLEGNVIYNRVVIRADVVPGSIDEEVETIGSGLSLTGKTMQFRVLNNNFTKSIGFASGYYPTEETDTLQMMKGQVVPQISPVLMMFVKCNLVHEPSTNFLPSCIGNYEFNANPRDLMRFEPQIVDYFQIQPHVTFGSIVFELVDQNNNPISYEQDEDIYFEIKIQSRYS